MSSKKFRSGKVQLATTYRVPTGLTLSAAKQVLQSLDNPRSLAVWIIIRDDPSQLKSLGFDPLHYNSLPDLRDAYAATKLLSKADFLESGIDTKQVAMVKFHEMEAHCKQTNKRFGCLSLDPDYKGPNVWLLNALTRKIENILVGYSPDELFSKAKWGPGVSTRIKGADVGHPRKFQNETGITRDLFSLINSSLKAAYPAWANHLETNGYPEFDVGNQVVTVPKDAFTDRTIAVEPGLNLWFQLAVGNMINDRLLVHGIDLSSQERNQQLAGKGSKDASLATVDFSSASDTIATGFLREVLPPYWFSLLDSARSHYGFIEGQAQKWEKFSSMGNGFTFQLESLIFYATALVVCEYLGISTRDVSVYGDDVILPSPAFDLFSSFSVFCGFIVNMSKSYSSCYFRESCGSHWFDGVDVKPLYIKTRARTLFEQYRQLNAIRRWAHRRLNGLGCDSTLKSAWLTLYRPIPKALRIFGSDGKGDGNIIGNFDEACPIRAKHGIEGFYAWQFAHIGVTRWSEEVGLLLTRLRSSSTQEYGNTYTLRGRTRVSFIRTLVARWIDLGPWL